MKETGSATFRADHRLSGASWFALFACAVLLVTAVLFSGIKLNNDAALLLQCGRLIVGGSVPYIDHVETNLHMAQYIHVPPVVLANLLGVNAYWTFIPGVLAIVLAVTWMAALLLRGWSRHFDPPGAVFVATAVLLISLKTFMNGDFGQREHLFLLALTPYLLVRLGRLQGVRIRLFSALAAGVFMGVLSMCKPVFLYQAALIEGWLWLRFRRAGYGKAPELLALVLVVFLSAAHLLLLPGSLGSPFFTRWIPFITGGYSAYNAPLPAMIRGNLRQWPFILGGLGLGVLAVRRADGTFRKVIETMIFGVLSALALFFLQHKGWLYQLLPAYGLSILLGCMSLSHLQRIRGNRFTAWALPASCVLVSVVFAVNSFLRAPERYGSMDGFLSIIENRSQPGDRIAFISTCVYPAYPTLVYADRLPGTRYLSAFPVALLYGRAVPDDLSPYHYSLPEALKPLDTLFLSEIGHDIRLYRPALVFIEASDSCQGCPPGFRMDEYLDGSGWTREYLADYRFLRITHDFRVYQLD